MTYTRKTMGGGGGAGEGGGGGDPAYCFCEMSAHEMEYIYAKHPPTHTHTHTLNFVVTTIHKLIWLACSLVQFLRLCEVFSPELSCLAGCKKDK